MFGLQAPGGFHEMTGRDIHWKSGSREISIQLEESGGHGVLQLDGRTIPFTIHDRDATGGWIESEGKNQRFYVHRNRDEVVVWIGGRAHRLVRIQKGQTSDETASAGSGEIRALMPGKILRIDVSTGQPVTEKQPLVIMTSMKMETTLAAPRAGTVSAVKCQVGQIVEMGELLVIVE